MPDFLRHPAPPTPPDLSTIDSRTAGRCPRPPAGPGRRPAASGDIGRGGQYLDLLERAQRDPRRLAAGGPVRGDAVLHHGLTGQLDEAVRAAGRAGHPGTTRSATMDRRHPGDPPARIHVPGRFPALSVRQPRPSRPGVTEPVRLVMVPGALALAWFESGHLAKAADAAGGRAAGAAAGIRPAFLRCGPPACADRPGAGRRDLDTAEHFAERALSISEHGGRPSSSWRCSTAPGSGPPAAGPRCASDGGGGPPSWPGPDGAAVEGR